MARRKKQKWQAEIEEILERSGFGQKQSRVDAFLGILEKLDQTSIQPDLLIPPDPWDNVFHAMFQVLLAHMPAVKACMVAFMMGEVWKMHQAELREG